VDLYERLSATAIRVPPLRERERDALLLAEIFLAEALRRSDAPPRRFGAAAQAAILAHGWPGNVREVANVVERVVLSSEGNPVEPADLGLPVRPGGRVAIEHEGDIRIDLSDAGVSLEAVERALLAAALAKTGGNQSAAARLLGLSRDTIRYRMEKYGLNEAASRDAR
jgi:DNA-binding NtrC family response regulator